MDNDQRIIAVGLLTARDIDVLGQGFHRLFPVDETPCFGELLLRIDEADRKIWRERDRERPTTKPVLRQI